MIRFLNAGESHGDKLVAIVENIPANLRFDIDFINKELFRRQIGYGRSERMKIESDRIKLISGVRSGYTTGNPISFTINNLGTNIETNEVFNPRPGHADFAGTLKFNQEGARNIIERASARETATRVAVGAICKLLLKEFDIYVYSHVIKIGKQVATVSYYNNLDLKNLKLAESSDVRTIKKQDELNFIEEIESAANNGDSLGGRVELIVKGLPIGLGSYSNWDRKLDAKLAQAIISVQGIKSVVFGKDLNECSTKGSEYHDEIYYNNKFFRKTNNAGGIEGGMTTGEELVIRADMKPIPTLKKELSTISFKNKKTIKAKYERSDVCAVPSASVVLESVVATVLADEMLEMLGGSFMEEITERYKKYKEYLDER